MTGLNLLAEENDTDHSVALTLSGGKRTAALMFPVHDTSSGWVYDTTEVPSGITS